MERSILKDIEMFREQLENVNDEEFSQLCEMEANLLNKWFGVSAEHICDGGDCGLEPCAETPVHREPGHARTVRPPRAALRSEAVGDGVPAPEGRQS